MDDIRPPLDKDLLEQSSGPGSEGRSRFVVELRASIRKHGLSYATEKTYVHWTVRYIRYHNMKHPAKLGGAAVARFLADLAESRNCSMSTQRTALNALVFLYQRHLKLELGKLNFSLARRPRRMPTVLTHPEAMAVINRLTGVHQIMVKLLYGSGLRAREAVGLRIKDLDFGSLQIGVRNAKGHRDRFTLLPKTLVADLKTQIELAERLHEYDKACGLGEVAMPSALAAKYPAGSKDFKWQFLFPATRVGIDPRTGTRKRHHRHYSAIQKAVKMAVAKAGIRRHVTAHTFRHSFATRLIETGYDIKLVQSLLGHSDINTTEIYLHVVKNRAGAIVSPVDTRL